MEIPSELFWFILGIISCFIFFGVFTYVVDKDKLKEEDADPVEEIKKFNSIIKEKIKNKPKEQPKKKLTRKEAKRRLNKMFKD